MAGGYNGGYQSHAEIYNTATQMWRQGPILPQPNAAMSSVQYKNTFLLVGGYNSKHYLDNIFQYNQSSETWILRPERLSRARDWMGAALVGSPVADCSRCNKGKRVKGDSFT